MIGIFTFQSYQYVLFNAFSKNLLSSIQVLCPKDGCQISKGAVAPVAPVLTRPQPLRIVSNYVYLDEYLFHYCFFLACHVVAISI